MPAIIGYARTSTLDQVAGLEAQQRDLEAFNCDRIFAEQVSSVAERGQLELALAAVGPGDTLVVTKPDRLARSTIDLLTIVKDLDARGAGLVVLSMGGERVDTRSPTSRLILTILAGVAAWEREIMLERQREGISKAKLDGKYKGRAPTAMTLADSAKLYIDQGATVAEVATQFGISHRSVSRIRKSLKSKETDRGFINCPDHFGDSSGIVGIAA
ncbi:MAG: recombinase family protein [Herpetosiphon sp.]